MFRHLPAALACLIMAFAGHSVLAAPVDPGKAVEIPERGLSMTEVKRGFGQPGEVLAPVGAPPITRWIYEGFTVYFDHSHVIHTVRHDIAGGNPTPSR